MRAALWGGLLMAVRSYLAISRRMPMPTVVGECTELVRWPLVSVTVNEAT